MTRIRIKHWGLPAVAATLVTASSVMADAFDDYVQLRVADSAGSTSSFTNNDAGHWQKKDGSGNFVVETEGPHAGEKYYAPNPLTVTATGTSASSANPIECVFEGDELAMAEKLWLTLQRSSASATDAVVRIGNLRLLPGGYFYNAGNNPAVVAGTCTVEATAYWQSKSSAGGAGFFSSQLLGDESAVFEFRSQSANKNLFTWTYNGDASGYFGTIRLSGSLAPARLTLATEGGFAMPGTIRLLGDAELLVSANSTATIGNLDSSGGALRLEGGATGSALGRLVVTNGFTESSGNPITITLPNSLTLSVEAETLPLVTFSGNARDSLSTDTFAVSADSISPPSETPLTNRLAACLANLSIAVTNAADGLSRTLAVSHRRMVWQTGGTPFAADGAASWSDNDGGDPDADYYLVTSTAGSSGAYTFQGASLSLCSSITFNKSTQLHVDDFVWVPGASILTYNANHTISGKIRIPDVPGKAFTVKMWNGGNSGHAFTVASEMSGGGSLTLSSDPSVKQDPRAFYVLSGINTNFAGRLALTHGSFSGANAATYNADPDMYCVTLTVTDPRNIGGAMAAFDAAGFTLGAHSLLKVTGSVAFDEPTRGWYIEDVGRIRVDSGETVTMTNMQVTYAGEFRKEGAGTLKLGGTARFTEEALETPLAGTNVLAIAEGALMPADTTGCDGLAITFAAGTKLLLDASAEGDLRTYGLYDVKWDAPIAVAGDAALPVAFALPDGFNRKASCRLGICTVSPTAADAMDVEDFAVKAPHGMKAIVSKVENRDAGDNVVSVSFVCDLIPRGTTICIR